MTLLSVLFYLLVMHATLDFPLQGDAVAINKNRYADTDLQKYVPWFYWMASHALIHGGSVALITGSVGLGIGETICHFLIDCGKCERWYNIHMDQFLHIFCKIVWAFIWVFTK